MKNLQHVRTRRQLLWVTAVGDGSGIFLTGGARLALIEDA